MTLPQLVLEKASQIKLLALDVDGVLTNGQIIYTGAGEEIKIFNVKDGHGISMLRRCGIEVALITGRNSSITQRRADELDIRYVYQGIKNKMPVLHSLLETLELSLFQVLYMGDDTPDIPILKAVGLAVCPADAVEEVKGVCHYTTKSAGGCGAVREMTDLLMTTQFPQGITTAVAQEVIRS